MNEKGNALLLSLLFLLIAVTTSQIIFQHSDMSLKLVNVSNQQLGHHELEKRIVNLLADPAICLENFGGSNISSFTNLVFEDGSPMISAASDYNDSLRIKDFTVASDGIDELTLNVNVIKRKTNILGSKEYTISIPINAEINAGSVDSCSTQVIAEASSDDLNTACESFGGVFDLNTNKCQLVSTDMTCPSGEYLKGIKLGQDPNTPVEIECASL